MDSWSYVVPQPSDKDDAGRGFELRLVLAIPPDWDRIDPIREAVSHSIAAVFTDKVLTDALSMVSAELLENAVKYGAQSNQIHFSVEQENHHVVVIVTNSVPEGSEHVAVLVKHLDWVKSFEDPAQAYLAVLEEIYNQPTPVDAPSRLGIVRIAYEGGCQLECDTSEPGRVTVRARYDLTRRDAGGGP